MNEKDLRQKVDHAFSTLAPETLPEEILSACTEQKGVLKMKKNNLFLKRILPIAAAFALVFTGILLLRNPKAPGTIVSTVALDVNPSIELKVNESEKVLEVLPRNEDARTIIGTMDFKGSNLDVTLNALIGSMLQKGYITEISNSVLITVDSPDPNEAARLQQKLTAEVGSLLHTETFDGAVVSQTATPNDSLKNQAETSDISVGKAQLIQKIIKANPQRTFEELATLSIHELNLLAESLPSEEITASGAASQKGYIGKDKARELALNHAGLTEAVGIEIELDYEMGKMCYELEFYAGNFEYEYDIDATTGAILKDSKKAQKPETVPGSHPDAIIAPEAAKEAALSHAGLTADVIFDYESEVDFENGSAVYEIDFKSGRYEYQYEIDALNGTVLHFEKEYDD